MTSSSRIQEIHSLEVLLGLLPEYIKTGKKVENA